MANIYRKSYTQPLPKKCEIVEHRGRRMALWIDRRGKKQYDEVTVGELGQFKIVRQSPTYVARFRDADGLEVIRSTGCRDEQAAKQVLADLVRRVEHVKSGILTTDQNRQVDHAARRMDDHVAAYLEHLRAKTMRGKKVSVHHRRNVKHQIERVVQECAFRRLADISREAMEKWMNAREAEGMGGRTRNTHRAAIVAFCNWCSESGRLGHNPLAKLSKADEFSDRRRVRRALDENAIGRLLKAARLRPVAEYGRATVPKADKDKRGRRTWTKAELTFEELDAAYLRGQAVLKDHPDLWADKVFTGEQRALMYRLMICTGLRKGELASLTVGQVYLNERYPHIEILAKDEKAGRGATIPLRADLVEELALYLNQMKARTGGEPLPLATPLFPNAADLIRVFDRDLAAACIPKHDERGRVVDIHALRHSFGTHLAKAGVPPRVAMAAMRHSTIDLTMSVYTDPALLDVASAVEALPSFTAKVTTVAPMPASAC